VIDREYGGAIDRDRAIGDGAIDKDGTIDRDGVVDTKEDRRIGCARHRRTYLS
jgi:hypothetical protein